MILGMSARQIRVLMLPLTLAVMPISALSAQSVKDYERAAIEKLRRERAAEAAARQRAEQETARQRAQAEQAQREQRAKQLRAVNEQRRKAAIAEAQRQERMRREKEALRRAALCQQAVEQKDQLLTKAECAAAAELGSRISAVHFGMLVQSQKTKNINEINEAVRLLVLNTSDTNIFEDPNGPMGPPSSLGKEVELLLADLILDNPEAIVDQATDSRSIYTDNGQNPREADIGLAYNIYVNSDVYNPKLTYRPKYRRSDIAFNNPIVAIRPSKKIEVYDTYRGEQIFFVKDARYLASRESIVVYFDPYAERIACHREGDIGSWSNRKCNFINGKISAAENSRGIKVPHWAKIIVVTECDLTYYPNPQRDGYSYCTFRLESDD